MPDLSHLPQRARTATLHYESFVTTLEGYLIQAAKDDSPVSLALFDIDLFGKTNEAYGRALGDELIHRLGVSLAESMGEACDVMRYGGDAQVAVLPGVSKEEAFLMAEKARTAFDREHIVRHQENDVALALTTSAGLAAFPDDGGKVADLVRKANEALYRAKVSGRNKVCLAREERMVTKTSHYTQGQLAGLSRLAKREGLGEADLLREALDDLLRKYNS